MPNRFELLRTGSMVTSTSGILFDVNNSRHFLCFTLEDEYREVKKKAHTRIPAGEYTLTLRQHGGHNTRYKKRFPKLHRGMIELDTSDRPEWSDILIHVGNSEEDTAGCVLLGDDCVRRRGTPDEFYVMHSTNAYKRVYPIIRDAIEADPDTRILIMDYDRPPVFST